MTKRTTANDDSLAGWVPEQLKIPTQASPSDWMPPTLKHYRLKEIVAPHGLLPISASTWWQGVKEGRYPQPVPLGPRIRAWRAQDIANFLERLRAEGQHE